MGLYLNNEIQKVINLMISNDCLENLIIYSEETTGKSLMAKYIADLYYSDIKTDKTLYYYDSIIISGLKKIMKDIDYYIKIPIEYSGKKYKKIVIIDDFYINDKYSIDYLNRLLSADFNNVVVFVITRNLNNIGEIIRSRCLCLYLKTLDPVFFKQILKYKYPDIKDDIINLLKVKTNNSIYIIIKLLQTIEKYKSGEIDINKEIKKIYMSENQNNLSYQELIKLTIDKKINDVVKMIKKFNDFGYYGEDVLNSSLYYVLNDQKIKDEIKAVFIENITKTMYKIYKYSDSVIQIINCFIKICESLNAEIKC